MHHGEVGLNPPQDKPLIDVEHLTRAFGTREQRVTVLDDVSFGVPRGSLFGIAGPSGSGKSTLLNLLTGLDRPSSGRVLFDGLELRARSENQLARWRGHHVGIVFQFFQLIPTLTALENVLLALELGGGGVAAVAEYNAGPEQGAWNIGQQLPNHVLTKLFRAGVGIVIGSFPVDCLVFRHHFVFSHSGDGNG